MNSLHVLKVLSGWSLTVGCLRHPTVFLLYWIFPFGTRNTAHKTVRFVYILVVKTGQFGV